MMNKILASTISMLLFVAFCGASIVQAATATTSLNVSTTVSAVCSVTTTPIDFPYVPNGISNSTGAIAVDCPDGTIYDVALDAGTSYSSTSGSRNMNSQGLLIPYFLYQDSNLGTEWGDGPNGTYPNGSTLTGSINAGPSNHTVYGTTSFSGNEPLGQVYTDAVLVTVTF